MSRADRTVKDTAGQYEAGSYWLDKPAFFLGDSLFKARNVVKALQTCNLPGAVRICDIGCGAGGVLHYVRDLLVEQGVEVLTADGYDISADAIAQGKTRFCDICLHQGRATDVADGYDVIMVLDVVEHLEDYYEVLRIYFQIPRRFVLDIVNTHKRAHSFSVPFQNRHHIIEQLVRGGQKT